MWTKKNTILRTVVKILSFILVSEMFSRAFDGLKAIYGMLLIQSLNITKLSISLSPIISVVFLCILFGRFFCGWFCAFGSLNDFLYLISSKVFGKRFTISPLADALLKYLKYAILLFIFGFVWTLKLLPSENYSPWLAFDQITQAPGIFFVRPAAYILLLLILIGSMFVERFFCKYLCPLGAVLSIISRLRFVEISKQVSSNCSSCSVCKSKCPMNINLDDMEQQKSGECIDCLKCIDYCPKDNIKIHFLCRNITRSKYITFAALTIIFSYLSSSYISSYANAKGYSVSNPYTASYTDNTCQSDSGIDIPEELTYKDGVFKGVSRGRRKNLTVLVKVKNGRVSEIEILSHKESRGYYEEPFRTIPKKIISSQSLDVDVVSGATLTSNGIINAVKDALSNAKE
ncbi:MAG: 4Fe-4S binding protein [Clostridia bacterium]|nr:4Fe-4S binding protein [Clostridia bacterium]